ncbi:VOC family protein [Trinickia acidisoli]|uniref:VOC family protein n=1 Tax=Trinickia acidisoli TaxID=2767482 RepID=UPI001A8EDFF0|nr:VOC family protein [Trinickia acidisoli]
MRVSSHDLSAPYHFIHYPTMTAAQERIVTSRRGTLNHIRLTVTDIDRARTFYDPLLGSMGYEQVESNDTRVAWAGWAFEGSVLQWFIISAASPENLGRTHDRYAAGFHHLAWNADSREQVDAFHALLLETGATVLDAPAEYNYEPGYYAVFFADPDGMKLELVHVPEAGSAAYWEAYKSRNRHAAGDI